MDTSSSLDGFPASNKSFRFLIAIQGRVPHLSFVNMGELRERDPAYSGVTSAPMASAAALGVSITDSS